MAPFTQVTTAPPEQPAIDPQDAQLLRGLMFAVPLGIAVWLALAAFLVLALRAF